MIAVLLLFAGAASARESIDKIAAEVNGEIILYSEVRERAFQMSSGGEDPNVSEKEWQKRALDMMVEEKLVIQYGKEKDIKVPSLEVDKAVEDSRKRVGAETLEALSRLLQERIGMTMERYRSMLHDQILAGKVISMEVRSQVQMTEEGIRDYYNDHQDLFAGRPKIRVSHILKYLPNTATEGDYDRALAEITDIRNEIMGGLDFAEAARKYSEDPSRDNGGDMGEVVKGEMVPEFEDVAFSLEPGIVSLPVRTQFGYHLIRVQYKAAAETAPLEKVKTEVESRIYAELVQSGREEWIKRLKKSALIDIKLQFN